MYLYAFGESQSVPWRAQELLQGDKLGEVVWSCQMQTFVKPRKGDVFPFLAGPAEVVQILGTRNLYSRESQLISGICVDHRVCDPLL